MSFLLRIWSLLRERRRDVFYIGGAAALPPPLTAEEEKALLKELCDEDESVKGVLYGEIPLDDMQLFNQILEEKQAKYLFLLDSDGNYIVRYGITLKEKSLIETLDMVRFDKDNPQVHNSTQVLEKMKKKEEILYAINRGQNEEIGVLTPIPDSSSVGVALMPDHGIDWIMFPA